PSWTGASPGINSKTLYPHAGSPTRADTRGKKLVMLGDGRHCVAILSPSFVARHIGPAFFKSDDTITSARALRGQGRGLKRNSAFSFTPLVSTCMAMAWSDSTFEVCATSPA